MSITRLFTGDQWHPQYAKVTTQYCIHPLVQWQRDKNDKSEEKSSEKIREDSPGKVKDENKTQEKGEEKVRREPSCKELSLEVKGDKEI